MSRPYLPKVQARSWAEIEREALYVLNRYYPAVVNEPQPVPIGHFIEIILPRHYDIDFTYAPLPPPTEGITKPGGAQLRPRITLSESVYERLLEDHPRARFTAAHECYHGLRHVRELEMEIVSGAANALYRKTEIPPYQNPERQADVFASRILMPGPAVRLALSQIGPDVPRLAEMFQVSQQAMAMRIGEIGNGK